MPRFSVTKQNGRIDWGRLTEWVASQPDGDYLFDGKRKPKKRTISQNDYYWGVVLPLCLAAMIKEGWEIYSTDDLHELFKSWFAGRKAINRYTAETVTFPASSKAMTTTEFSAFVDKVRDYADEYLGIQIPEPVRG